MGTRTGEEARALVDRRFVLALAGITVLLVFTIGVWTRGRSRQLAVEARFDEIRAEAEMAGVPLIPLLALCVARREAPRSLAGRFADALRKQEGNERNAVFAIFEDRVAAKMAWDLCARNKERWARMMAR